jgi:ABC-2 type transport system ATP-binding protein
MARSPKAVNDALAALMAADIELAGFSMGSPSLEEVFFALTSESRERETVEHEAA